MPKIVKLPIIWDSMGIYGSQWEIILVLWYSLSLISALRELSESNKPRFVSKL